MFSFLLHLKRWLLRLLKVRSESRQATETTFKLGFLRTALLLFSALLISLIYPGKELFYPLDIPHRGESVEADVVAPFRLIINKSEQELNAEKQLAASAIPFPVRYDSAVTTTVLRQFDTFWDMTDSLSSVNTSDDSIEQQVGQLAKIFPQLSESVIRQSFVMPDTRFLRVTLRAILADSILKTGVLSDTVHLPEVRGQAILVKRGERESILPKEKLPTMAIATGRLLAILNRMGRTVSMNTEYWYLLGRGFLSANLIPEHAEYQEKLNVELTAISPVREIIENGDLLIAAGSLIGEREERILAELAHQEHLQRLNNGWLFASIPIVARFLLVAGLFGLLYLFLRFYRPAVYSSPQKLFTIFLVFGVQLALLFFISRFTEASAYLYPVAFLPILITILFDMEIGLVATFVLALLMGVLERFDFTLTLMSMLVGAVACYASRRVRKRSTFFRIIASVSLACMAFTLVVESMRITAEPDIMSDVIASALNGVMCGLLAFGLLPFFEALFGFATDITLLELSDPNHPLLRRLALEAPGTYQHSIVVANLSEAAAKAISANSLLARVGCYYHDIGKMEIPEYFVENQVGVKSKHEQLSPSMSALILTAHVKKGRTLGEQSDIPDDVLNFIEEHHGTMVMSYFYDKALKMGEDAESIDKYRYHGPKPQTRETGICMLADAVEAASRTLDDPKPSRIMNLIERIINDRFQSGELDECPLTLRDLAKIKDAFAQVLISAFHHRIEYPKRDITATV